NGKKKEDVHYFAINNSISSLYCLEHNCIIILGSYDGTLTIIDTTQKNTDPNYTTKNFINEDYEAKTVIHPRTVAKGHIDTQLPIIGIAYNDNALYCATKNTIYTCPTPLFTTNTETALNITQVCSVDDDNNITAISLCNTNLTYATDKGMVTILYENN